MKFEWLGDVYGARNRIFAPLTTCNASNTSKTNEVIIVDPAKYAVSYGPVLKFKLQLIIKRKGIIYYHTLTNFKKKEIKNDDKIAQLFEVNRGHTRFTP